MSINKDQSAAVEIRLIKPIEWVSNYADYLYSYALIRINDEELSKDLVQDTFLAALEQVGKFQGLSSERTWLTAILKNKIIDVYRKKTPRKLRDREDVANFHEAAAYFDTDTGHWKKEHQPERFGNEENNPLTGKEFNYILQKCMKKLPVLWLSVFTMKLIDDENTETICRELKITASNFWVIIHRSKVNLRSCLQKNWI